MEQTPRSLEVPLGTATALLAVMAFVFVAASLGVERWPGLQWVRAFAEAAMVGGLADWFAVVALFRHPLGLRIPHTAILPANQDRIAFTMGRFIQANFFSPEALRRKVREGNPALLVRRWLERRDVSERLATAIVEGLLRTLVTLDDGEVQRFLKTIIAGGARAIRVAPLAGYVAEAFVNRGKCDLLFERILTACEHFFEEQEEQLRRIIGDELPWYVPRFVHERVYANMVQRARTLLGDILLDREHEMRKWAFSVVTQVIDRLKYDPELRRSGDELIECFLNDPEIRGYATQVIRELRELVTADAAEQHSELRGAIAEMIRVIPAALERDREIAERINRACEELVATFVETYGDEISGFLSDTVRCWDSRTLIEKIEREVRMDLQYIRLNGTIVGGLAGVLIHALSFLFERG